MAKATEYYNLEKTAEVLSLATAEVNRLREQGKLRGLRDGSNWKFIKDEIHSYLAEQIKARGGSGGQASPAPGGGASSSSFDLLMEDAPLPGDSQLVSVKSRHTASDIDLGAAEDDLSLAEETMLAASSSPRQPTGGGEKTPPFIAKPAALEPSESGFDLIDAEDSSSVSGAEATQVAAVPGGNIAASAAEDDIADLEVADEEDLDIMNISEATHVAPVQLKAAEPDEEGSDFALAEATHVSSVPGLAVQSQSAPSASDFDLAPLDDSSVLPASSAASSAPDKKPQKTPGSSPQLGLASQSELDGLEEKSSNIFLKSAAEPKEDSEFVEFDLEVASDMIPGTGHSESSSQVVAIEGMFQGASSPDLGAAPLGDDSGIFTSAFDTASNMGQAPQPDGGLGFPTNAIPSSRTSSTPIYKTAAADFSPGALVALTLAVLLLLLPALMVIDTAAHLWSWDEQPFVLNSWIMGWFAGLLGLT